MQISKQRNELLEYHQLINVRIEIEVEADIPGIHKPINTLRLL